MAAAADGAAGPVPVGKGGQGGAPHDVVLLPLKDLKLSDSESQTERRAHFDKSFEKILADIAGAETKLRVMLRILSVAGDLEVYSHAESKDRDDQLHRLAKRLGIDAAKLLKGLQAEAAAKAKPKKKAVRK